jgi:hypothetical protein
VRTAPTDHPKDFKARAKVNGAMDWINFNFYRDWEYNFCYPARQYKKLPNWQPVNEAFYGLVEAVKAQPFHAI